MRKKGIPNKQKMYLLPEGVSYKLETLPKIFNKETYLTFIDREFGEFTSTIKNLHRAKSSTHPQSVQRRKENTNILLFGGTNPSHSKEVREKAKNTMVNRYGVEHALLNKDLLQKSKNTLMENFGVDNPFKSPIIRETWLKNMEDRGTKGTPTSKGEIELLEYIKSLGFSEAKKGYIGGKKPCEIDIKIKEKNIGIEYNGMYYHTTRKKPIRYHIDKTNQAKDQGLDLIHIFESEWKDRKEQVKSFIKSKLGKNENIIYARNCEIKEVQKKEAREFLDKYHILGSCNFKKAFGLYYNEKLISMITIGIHHRNNKDVVLNRFIGKTDYNVAGGLSRLCKTAYKEFGEFVTWVDLRWSNGENWIKSGWIKESQLKPDYFYYDTKKHKVISKQMRRKKIVNTPVNMTEKEHALIDGLYQIYDCGKLRLRYKG